MSESHKKRKRRNRESTRESTREPTREPTRAQNDEEQLTVEEKLWSHLNIRNSHFLLVLLLFASITQYIHKKVSKEQVEPYMDEIFHIPQALKYYFGRYEEWDPKITTLPGTYMIANAFLSIYNRIWPGKDYDELCSVYNYRSVNVFVCVLNFAMIYNILGYYCPNVSIYKRMLSAVNIATFPVLYFFSFLFYTDTLSTAALLYMHISFLKAEYGRSAFGGFWAVVCRQTNIVWVFYHGLTVIIQTLLIHYEDKVYLFPTEWRKIFTFTSSRSTGRTYHKGKRSMKMLNKPASTKPMARSPFSNQVPSLIRIWKDCSDEIIDQGFFFFCIGVGFIIFVLYNGGIVVGDKLAHQAAINIPQVFYFALIFGIFTVSFMATRIKLVGAQLISHPRTVLALCVLFAAIIYFNSPAHPYLLADNRHYTFYVWKRFYENVPFLRYMWIPFYIMVWSLISCASCLPKIVVCNYVLCVCINLIPQLLLEFRYFIPAYLFARLTFKNPSWFELILECYIHVCFNYLTLHLFLNKPFLWGDTDQIQRFMW